MLFITLRVYQMQKVNPLYKKTMTTTNNDTVLVKRSTLQEILDKTATLQQRLQRSSKTVYAQKLQIQEQQEDHNLDADEPLLQDQGIQRFLLTTSGPTWDFYKKGEKATWHAWEVHLHEERICINKLTHNEQRIVKLILAFFAAADGIVNENIATNFASEVKNPQARCFYAFQSFIETVHQEVYTNLLNVYVPDKDEYQQLMHAIENTPVIAAKAEWAVKWIGTEQQKAPFGQRLFAFACVEGIHFASSFAIIYWFKQGNRLPGLAEANDFIARDETTHWLFPALLSMYVIHKPSQDTVEAIVNEAVELEIEFVKYVLLNPLPGLNADLMTQYVESMADLILIKFGYKPLYGASNPFSFMKMLELVAYSNFFEKPPPDYEKAQLSEHQTIDFTKLKDLDF